MPCCDLKCGLITGTVLGALIAVLGGILIPVGNTLIENTVHTETVLENGTLAFDTWTSVDTPMYRQFWLFDVQNPDDVLSQGAKPVLVQKGPYTYRTRFIPKTNITFTDNYTVSFVLPLGAIFEPSMSVGTEEDVFTSLNLAVAGVYSLLNHTLANWLIQSSGSTLFQNRTVKELLWGYKDPMLGSTLGVFYPYNDTIDGPYTVFTGKDDINKVATIESWAGEPSLSYWNDTYCNKINGTGTPVLLSLPHFLYGSNDLHQGVIGLNPNFDEHSIFLDVEPITGFTLRFAKRLQVNMLYGPSDSIVILNKIKDYTVFPILWVNETAVLDDETADMFKKELISRMDLLEGFQIGLIVVGLVLFASCLIGLIVVCTKPSNNKFL
ncbi:platelet glycoprotein 4-like [Sinocyclocheilus rhinocerous]|uniref:platelet glycoprotein 4-like n=1 Tax=Sinocyclocheilus rhinocerous TaxID=307959 RepID=UPI0007B80D45|nr:PREDICTED: platelet glycoprotein 4-like [Sinocyclocheilus rhinocerous]